MAVAYVVLGIIVGRDVTHLMLRFLFDSLWLVRDLSPV